MVYQFLVEQALEALPPCKFPSGNPPIPISLIFVANSLRPMEKKRTMLPSQRLRGFRITREEVGHEASILAG